MVNRETREMNYDRREFQKRASVPALQAESYLRRRKEITGQKTGREKGRGGRRNYRATMIGSLLL